METIQKILVIGLIFSTLLSLGLFIASQKAPNFFEVCETCHENMLMIYSYSALAAALIFGSLALFYKKFDGKFAKAFEDTKLVWIILGVCVFLYVVSISYEMVLDDSFSHFLNQKYSWLHPVLFFNFWHKPLFNFIMSFPAQLGIYYISMFNVAVSLATVYFTYLTAKELKIQRPYLAAILCAFAPVFYLVATSDLSEPLFALFSIIAIYFLAKEDYFKSCLFVSLLPFTRTEGIFAVAIWCLLLWRENKIKFSPFLFIVPVAITVISSIAKNDILWIIHDNVYIGHSYYGTGPITTFFEQFFFVAGPAALLFVQIGLFRKFKDPKFFAGVWLFLTYFLFYVIGFMVGGIAVADEVREMAAVVPIIAILGAVGLNEFFDRKSTAPKPEVKNQDVAFCALFVAEVIFLIFFIDDFRDKVFTAIFAISVLIYCAGVFQNKIKFISNDILLAGKVALILFTVLSAVIYVHPPKQLNDERKALLETAQWIEENGFDNRPFLSAHAFMYWAADKDPYTKYLTYNSAFWELRSAETGTILVWDNHYSERYAKMKKSGLESYGYVLLKTIEFRNIKVDIFEKKSQV